MKQNPFDNAKIKTGGNTNSFINANVSSEQLYPCKDCGRTFREEVIKKHEKICKKVFKQKRKQFDTKKKRLVDSEHAMINKTAEKMNKMNAQKLDQIKVRNKQNWKKQSEGLRQVARANRMMDGGKSSSNGGMDVLSKGKYQGGSSSNYGGKYSGGSTSKYSGGSSSKYSGGSSSNYNNNSKNPGGYGNKQSYPVVQDNTYDDFTPCDLCGRKYNEEAYNKHLSHCQKKYKETQIKEKLAKPKGKYK